MTTLLSPTPTSRFLSGALRGLHVLVLIAFAGVCLGAFGYALAVWFHAPVLKANPWQMRAPLLASGIVGLGATVFIVRRLKSLFDNFRAGQPFHAGNPGHLRAMAFALIIMETMKFAAGVVQSRLLAGMPIAHGQYISLDPSLVTWLLVLLLFAFAEAFREGARLNDDSALTI